MARSGRSRKAPATPGLQPTTSVGSRAPRQSLVLLSGHRRSPPATERTRTTPTARWPSSGTARGCQSSAAPLRRALSAGFRVEQRTAVSSSGRGPPMSRHTWGAGTAPTGRPSTCPAPVPVRSMTSTGSRAPRAAHAQSSAITPARSPWRTGTPDRPIFIKALAEQRSSRLLRHSRAVAENTTGEILQGLWRFEALHPEWTDAKRVPSGGPADAFDHPVSDRDRPFDGLRVIDVERDDEIALWLSRRRALVFGDAMIRTRAGEPQRLPRVVDANPRAAPRASPLGARRARGSSRRACAGLPRSAGHGPWAPGPAPCHKLTSGIG